jgi:hypothetical protein
MQFQSFTIIVALCLSGFAFAAPTAVAEAAPVAEAEPLFHHIKDALHIGKKFNDKSVGPNARHKQEQQQQQQEGGY